MATLRLNREFYIPKNPGTRKVSLKGTTAVVYLYERAGTPFATAFRSDRTKKPDYQYRFKDEAQRENFVRRFFKNILEREESKKERRAQRKAKAAERTYKVGDILYSSWGYDQTNIDFYEVVALKGKCSVVLREIRKTSVAGEDKCGPMSDQVVANKGDFIGEPFTKRDQGGSIKIESYAYAYKWDGRALYRSWCH